MSWQDKIQVKKGNIGESYVKLFLEKMGFIVYAPITEGSHKIDFFAHHGDKKNVISIEAKAKKRMAIYEETGFNYNAYLHYLEIQKKHNIPTYIYFIDEFEECIYGQWLEKLGEGIIRKNVIVWNLSKMQFLRWLTKDEIEELKKYTAKDNYDYSKVNKYFSKNGTT